MDKLIDGLMNVIRNNNGCDEENDEIIRFGLELLVMKIIIYTAFLLIGILTGCLLHILLFMLAYQPLRTYSGGYHHKSRIGCLIFSVSILLSVILAVKLIPDDISSVLVPVISLISIPGVLIFAPVESEGKPIEPDERKAFRKKIYFILIIELSIIFALLYFNYPQYALPIGFGIFFDTLFLIIPRFIKATPHN